MKKVVMPLFVIGVLCLIPYIGVQYAGLGYLFAVIIPCASLVVLIAGFAIRMVNWLIRPVPFRIPTTCGQEKSLDYKDAKASVYKRDQSQIIKEDLPIEKEQPLQKELQAFIDCVEQNKEPLVSGEVARTGTIAMPRQDKTAGGQQENAGED